MCSAHPKRRPIDALVLLNFPSFFFFHVRLPIHHLLLPVDPGLAALDVDDTRWLRCAHGLCCGWTALPDDNLMLNRTAGASPESVGCSFIHRRTLVAAQSVSDFWIMFPMHLKKRKKKVQNQYIIHQLQDQQDSIIQWQLTVQGLVEDPEPANATTVGFYVTPF